MSVIVKVNVVAPEVPTFIESLEVSVNPIFKPEFVIAKLPNTGSTKLPPFPIQSWVVSGANIETVNAVVAFTFPVIYA